MLLMIIGLYWNSLMNNLSRAYEIAYLVFHYDYAEINNPLYIKELTAHEKFFCHKDHYNPELITYLKQSSQEGKILHARGTKITEKIHIHGQDYICKHETCEGILKNLLVMNRCVYIWNNGHFAKKIGLSALKPVALIEKRSLRATQSSVLYLLEGIDGEIEANRRVDFFPEIENLVYRMIDLRMMHQDFRLKNLVVLPDNTIVLIDIDKIHQYPKYSYVFHKRLAREIKKFNTKNRDKRLTDRTLFDQDKRV